MATKITLGISPGTKEMGIAVMKDIKLLDWGVKTFKGEWSNKKKDKILSVVRKYCNQNQVTHIAIKMPHCKRSSPALDRLVEDIIEFATQSKIKVHKFSLDGLKKCYTDTNKVCKREMMAITTMYDHLLGEIQSRHDNYYMKVLEAVALARTVTHKKATRF